MKTPKNLATALVGGRFRLLPVALVCALALCLLSGSPAPSTADEPASERLQLFYDVEKRSVDLTTKQRKPFDLFLVAERDAEVPEISTAVFKLELPPGVLLVGEDVLVQSLISLGAPKTGMHLTFQCETESPVVAMRFRLMAIQPLEDAVIRTVPDAKTNFLGLVSCKTENYSKFEVSGSEVALRVR